LPFFLIFSDFLLTRHEKAVILYSIITKYLVIIEFIYDIYDILFYNIVLEQQPWIQGKKRAQARFFYEPEEKPEGFGTGSWYGEKKAENATG
jgi:hypothetical protein